MRRSDQTPGEEPLIRRAEDRVLVGQVLEAAHRSVVVLEPHLPEARVPAEDRGIATAVGEAVERVAHAPRPVLVVTDARVQPVTSEHLGVLLQVLADRDVDAEPLLLRPSAGTVAPSSTNRRRRSRPRVRAARPTRRTSVLPGRARSASSAVRVRASPGIRAPAAVRTRRGCRRCTATVRPNRCRRSRWTWTARAGSAREARRALAAPPGTHRRARCRRSASRSSNRTATGRRGSPRWRATRSLRTLRWVVSRALRRAPMGRATPRRASRPRERPPRRRHRYPSRHGGTTVPGVTLGGQQYASSIRSAEQREVAGHDDEDPREQRRDDPRQSQATSVRSQGPDLGGRLQAGRTDLEPPASHGFSVRASSSLMGTTRRRQGTGDAPSSSLPRPRTNSADPDSAPPQVDA